MRWALFVQGIVDGEWQPWRLEGTTDDFDLARKSALAAAAAEGDTEFVRLFDLDAGTRVEL
jgi:hypothetical protein